MRKSLDKIWSQKGISFCLRTKKQRLPFDVSFVDKKTKMLFTNVSFADENKKDVTNKVSFGWNLIFYLKNKQKHKQYTSIARIIRRFFFFGVVLDRIFNFFYFFL
jgi:hypothetical protein